MDKNEILEPILTAINDLKEEVRGNRNEIIKNREAIQRNSEAIQRNSEAIQRNSEAIQRNSEAIQRNSEAIQRNSELIKKNSEKIDGNSKNIMSLEERMKKHEVESRNDRKAILDILFSYEQVTNRQYEENKRRIEKVEEKIKIISA